MSFGRGSDGRVGHVAGIGSFVRTAVKQQKGRQVFLATSGDLLDVVGATSAPLEAALPGA